MIYFLLLSLASATYQNPGGYAYGSQSAASSACEAAGLTLCTANQLYTVVYSTTSPDATPNLCFTGWTSDTTGDYIQGWWNNDVNSCSGKVGWNNWVPANGVIGAHCCSEDVVGTVPASCGDFSCGDGFAKVDGAASLFCADGTCTQDVCCEAWSAADRYKTYPGPWDYEYTSGADADAACQAANPDWRLCTVEQVEGLAADGEEICSSGWYSTGNGEYARGWWVSQEQADAGLCGGVAGEQTWTQGDGTGTAHCCTPSYSRNSYGGLAPDNDFASAEAYCAGTHYTTSVCTVKQMETVSLTEDQNICTSGFYRSDDQDTTGSIGWWQGVGEVDGNEVCNGITGLRSWASATPVAHCCADYVMEPDLGQWTYDPEYYSGGFASGADAASHCTDMGYAQLCSKGQVAWIGSNLQTDLCVVGWATDGGDYVSGYWQTTGDCGSQNTWNDAWQPATPVAFCCMADVEEMTLTQNAYYNSDWDYSYSTVEAAASMCTGDYSLCSRDQVRTVATLGVVLSDGTTQTEDNICRLAWTSDAGMGWWQGTDAECGGVTGWRSFDSASAGYHCCLDFEAGQFESPPTAGPTVGTYDAFALASSLYEFSNMQDAAQACSDINARYSLCSAKQVVEVALNGAPGDATFNAVAAQTELCFSSWLDTSQASCDVPHTHGWFRVIEGCGSAAWTWNTFAPTDVDGNTVGGAFCCADTVVAREDYQYELGCAPETTLTPTGAPVVKEFFELSDDVAAALGIDNTDFLYTRDNQYYYSEDNGATGYHPTCIAASTSADAACDYSSLVCAGVLRTIYGTLEEQGVLVAQAIAETDFLHANCPPPGCEAYDGYSPEDFGAVVSYCSYNGCYYMNGMETCVCDAASQDVAADLQNLWDNVFDLTECPDTRTFDEIMDDQLWITDQMVTDLETQIDSMPDVNTQLSSAQGDLQTIWDNWQVEITSSINAAISTAESDGNTALADQLNGILTSLDELSD